MRKLHELPEWILIAIDFYSRIEMIIDFIKSLQVTHFSPNLELQAHLGLICCGFEVFFHRFCAFTPSAGGFSPGCASV